MNKLETIMTIVISMFASIVIGAWILHLGEFAGMTMIMLGLIIGVGMLQPEDNTIVIEVEVED